MKNETMIRIIDSVFKDLDDRDDLTIAFQGGEPALAGLGWFENFTTYVASLKRNVMIHYAFQTNGLLLDENWAQFLKEHDFLVGLSIDANAKVHNKNRPGPGGEGTFLACLRSKALLEKHGVDCNILCVLTNELGGMPGKVWNFILNEKVRYIQFIPCLEGLDGKEESPFTLRPAKFANFYIRLYSLWVKELEKGSYISVKFFDDTANYFFRNLPNACGIDGGCQSQYVVESDGSVYPCDFFVLDGYNTGNLAEKTPKELFYSEKMQAFIREERDLPGICLSCPYRDRCGGGCKRMRNTMYYGSGASFCGYKKFLDTCLESLEYTVKKHFPS
jgi:uncharacterized protein